jgi:GT2 family glycosyltransferase
VRDTIQSWLKTFPIQVPVVVIPVFNAYEDALECINSLILSTSSDIPILMLDDASTDERVQGLFATLCQSGKFNYVRKSSNSGFVGTVNLAFDACYPHDVIVVNSDVIVPPEWLDRLRDAAYARSTIATATPLTNNGTLLSVPYRNKPVFMLDGGLTPQQADKRIRAMSLKLRPILPTAIGHCTYFKRSALSQVGYFDEVFAPGYGEEVDFSQRANTLGFTHVAADDLFVFHKGSRSFGKRSIDTLQKIRESHEEIISTRYPWYHRWVREAENDLQGNLALALERARAALLGYRVAIDATCINGVITGTQVLTLELINALCEKRESSYPNYHLSIIVNDTVPISELRGVDKKVDQVIRLSSLRQTTAPIFDLVHRPYQVTSEGELNLLMRVSARLVVSHLDCISYINPIYHANDIEWFNYRSLTKHVFNSAEGIAFISHDAASDALHQGLINSDSRTCVTYVGTDHAVYAEESENEPDADLLSVSTQPFILVIGTNFKHKNRPYAIKLFRHLIQKYQWSGNLVLVGPLVAHGGTGPEETLEMTLSKDLSSRIFSFGAASEADKAWLLKRAALLLYPTNYEGFGFMPFEAAAVGTPAICGSGTSLIEVLGQELLYLDKANLEMSVDTVWSILSNPMIASQQMEAIQLRAKTFTWCNAASATFSFYQSILMESPRLRGPISSPNQARVIETPVKAWLRRLTTGIHILLTKGKQPFTNEIRQYLKWRFKW